MCNVSFYIHTEMAQSFDVTGSMSLIQRHWFDVTNSTSLDLGHLFDVTG